MFSSDQNIETIAQLVEEVKSYLALKLEYHRLSLVEKLIQLLTVVVIACVLVALLLLVVIFFSFFVAQFIGEYVGTHWGFAIVGLFYLCIFFLFIIFRKQWIERPIVHLLASILMENKNGTNL